MEHFVKFHGSAYEIPHCRKIVHILQLSVAYHSLLFTSKLNCSLNKGWHCTKLLQLYEKSCHIFFCKNVTDA